MIIRGYKILFKLSPQNMAWRTANCIAQQLSPYFILVMSAKIINGIVAGDTFRHLFTLALITVIGQFLLAVTVDIINRFAWKYEDIMWQREELWFMQQQNRMKYEYLDDADITMLRTRITNAKSRGGNGLMQLYWAWWFIIQAVINVCFSVALTFSLFTTFSPEPQSGLLAFINNPWSGLLLIGTIVLNAVVSIYTANRSADMSVTRNNEFSKRHMRADGYWATYAGYDGAIFNFKRVALKYLKATIDPEFRNETSRLAFKYGAIKTCFMALMNFVLLVFVGGKAYIGVIGIGSIVLYRGTIEKFIDACANLGWRVGRLFKNNDYMQDIFDFFDLPAPTQTGEREIPKNVPLDIEFRNVTFKYPKTDVYALRNVSLKLGHGKKIAVVGRNGSGKTTLIKLLCRLYDPTEGEILLCGVPISEYKYDEYIKALAVVFQDFSIFAFTIAENVACDDKFDREKVLSALDKAGLGERVRGLETGIDTQVFRYYENSGIDISGGEKQKLAIARALYKDSPLVILDEPTASLDPLAEAEVYSHFDDMVSGKTSVYISHRLSSCRFCDEIAVFDNGSLVQLGSHDDLVKDEAGKYHELWNAQAQYYTE